MTDSALLTRTITSNRHPTRWTRYLNVYININRKWIKRRQRMKEGNEKKSNFQQKRTRQEWRQRLSHFGCWSFAEDHALSYPMWIDVAKINNCNFKMFLRLIVFTSFCVIDHYDEPAREIRVGQIIEKNMVAILWNSSVLLFRKYLFVRICSRRYTPAKNRF